MSTDEITGHTTLVDVSGQVVFASAPPPPSSDGGDDGRDATQEELDNIRRIGDVASLDPSVPEKWKPLTRLV